MSTAETIRNRILKIRRNEPFTNKQFLKLASRTSVDKALSRFVQEGIIQRIMRGVFIRPKENRYIGKVMPDVTKILETIARDHGETIQVHGAEAARRFNLSTQVPTVLVYNTSGPSREITIGKLTVRLRHTAQRKLCLAGKRPGLALSALWHLGKENVSANEISTIRQKLTPDEFETLKQADIPAWMADALTKHEERSVHA